MTGNTTDYRVDVVSSPQRTGGDEELVVRIIGPDGDVVTDLAEQHGKRLHLIVVGHDLTLYRHLHPTPTSDGGWRAPITLDTPGPYRAFADFVPTATGEGVVRGADFTVARNHRPGALPEPAPSVDVDDYEVTLGGDARPGGAGELSFDIRRAGEPVTDLEPYLGAYGHLVALRVADLAFLHVHPQDGPPGPEVRFHAELPGDGAYRLFLDFQHDGTVRTAAFTLR
ncbi:hypothetical protein J4H86_16010 [Spiractinospora alimapuensis]|uniref:FixH family protein n=1 Tax=Spiractinospora alimapuensis TaxID=2820884 RepID=UPI001F15FF81|nr:FixH family protein [Spiractinospora alimapuensis]QVQ50428.1 hypothetical protein J4H86_16010 [Spiractinospora alimapuensis]